MVNDTVPVWLPHYHQNSSHPLKLHREGTPGCSHLVSPFPFADFNLQSSSGINCNLSITALSEASDPSSNNGIFRWSQESLTPKENYQPTRCLLKGTSLYHTQPHLEGIWSQNNSTNYSVNAPTWGQHSEDGWPCHPRCEQALG